ncbi:MAG: ankyrin repeat domain-containing protein [bacterium]
MKKLVLSLWVVVCGVFAEGDPTDIVKFERVCAEFLLRKVCEIVEEIPALQKKMEEAYKARVCKEKKLSDEPADMFSKLKGLYQRVQGFEEFYAKIASELDLETAGALDEFQREGAEDLKRFYGKKIDEFNQLYFRIAKSHFEDPGKAEKLKFLQENCLKIIKFFCKHWERQYLSYVVEFSKLKQLKDRLNILLMCVLEEEDVDVDMLSTIFTIDGVDPNFRAPWFFCPLSIAIAMGNEKAVKELIQRGADPNRKVVESIIPDDPISKNLPCRESTLIESAVKGGNLVIVRDLLPYVSKPNLNKALICAIENGFLDIMKELIRWGADITSHDGKGRPCLFLSIMSGNLEAVRILLKHKVDVNTQDTRGITALMVAVYMQNHKLVSLLLGSGSDVNKAGQYVSSDGTNYINAIALNIAVVHKDLEIVQMLLDAHSEVDHCCTIGVMKGSEIKTIEATSLNIAVQTGNEPLVQKLLNAGAREVKPFSADVVRKNKSCIKMLLEAGISPDKIPVECFCEDFIYTFIKTVCALEGEPSYEEAVEAFKGCSGRVTLLSSHAKKLKKFCLEYGKKAEKSVVPMFRAETSEIATGPEEQKNTAFHFVQQGELDPTNTQKERERKALAAQRKALVGEGLKRKR